MSINLTIETYNIYAKIYDQEVIGFSHIYEDSYQPHNTVYLNQLYQLN